MTTAQVVETSVTVTNNSLIQDYVHPDDQTQPTFIIKAKLMEDEGSHPPAAPHLLLKCNLTQQTELQTYTARIYMYRLSLIPFSQAVLGATSVTL